MSPAMRWDFSRVLAVIGLFAGAARVVLAFLGDPGGEMLSGEVLGALGTGILFVVGGMLAGALLDVIVHVRRRRRSRDHGRHSPRPRR